MYLTNQAAACTGLNLFIKEYKLAITITITIEESDDGEINFDIEGRESGYRITETESGLGEAFRDELLTEIQKKIH